MADKIVKEEDKKLDGASKSESVMYVGRASRREISAKDWENVGASGQSDTAWGWENDLSIPAENFSEAALKYLQSDPGFMIVAND